MVSGVWPNCFCRWWSPRSPVLIAALWSALALCLQVLHWPSDWDTRDFRSLIPHWLQVWDVPPGLISTCLIPVLYLSPVMVPRPLAAWVSCCARFRLPMVSQTWARPVRDWGCSGSISRAVVYWVMASWGRSRAR